MATADGFALGGGITGALIGGGTAAISEGIAAYAGGALALGAAAKGAEALAEEDSGA